MNLDLLYRWLVGSSCFFPNGLDRDAGGSFLCRISTNDAEPRRAKAEPEVIPARHHLLIATAA